MFDNIEIFTAFPCLTISLLLANERTRALLASLVNESGGNSEKAGQLDNTKRTSCLICALYAPTIFE